MAPNPTLTLWRNAVPGTLGCCSLGDAPCCMSKEGSLLPLHSRARSGVHGAGSPIAAARGDGQPCASARAQPPQSPQVEPRLAVLCKGADASKRGVTAPI